jgi:hypothetical protein
MLGLSLGAHFGEREFSKGSSFSEEGKDKIQGEENPRTPTLESLGLCPGLVSKCCFALCSSCLKSFGIEGRRGWNISRTGKDILKYK